MSFLDELQLFFHELLDRFFIVPVVDKACSGNLAEVLDVIVTELQHDLGIEMLHEKHGEEATVKPETPKWENQKKRLVL
jgi:hypothetical protein